MLKRSSEKFSPKEKVKSEILMSLKQGKNLFYNQKPGTKNELDLMKQIIRDQEQFLRDQQIVINQLKEEIVKSKQELEENKITINDLLMVSI